MTLFRLDASIRREGSVSRAIADVAESQWCDARPDAPVTRRSVGLDPVPATTWALSVTGRRVDEAARSDAQRAAMDLATTLADELVDAEAFLFAIPLYNFGVSQHFKAWVDVVITDPRLSPSGPHPLKGRPSVLVVVRGGGYGAGTPREGWDHASGWYRRILADVWGLDLRVVETELTLAGVSSRSPSSRTPPRRCVATPRRSRWSTAATSSGPPPPKDVGPSGSAGRRG
ncbi:MAG: FMN-dependent NADH-azoreductase [Acidimicrobiales bacterium]